MSEEGFDWKCGNYFIQKDEWLMYAWLGMMYEFFFCTFWKQIQIDFHFIVISNSWNHSTLIFFFYFSKSFLRSNQLLTKHFLIIYFKTLFEWHAWNCQGFVKVWKRWWRLTRELPQFELVSGKTKCVWVFPNYWWYERNDRDFKNLPLVWEPRMVLRYKSVFGFFQLRRVKNDEVFTSCP